MRGVVEVVEHTAPLIPVVKSAKLVSQLVSKAATPAPLAQKETTYYKQPPSPSNDKVLVKPDGVSQIDVKAQPFIRKTYF